MSEWYAIGTIILICLVIFSMLASVNARGIGIALFILFSLVLIQLGSKGTVPVFSFWRDGFKVLVHYLIHKSI